MGWMHRKRKPAEPAQPAQPAQPAAAAPLVPIKGRHEDLKPTTSFLESTADDPRRYQPLPPDTPDEELPLIPPSLITLTTTNEEYDLIWLVIDNVVYDCTAFVAQHPGGADVLRSLRGSDCSWQFWRFHGKRDMVQFGRPLRVGRTEGVPNRFAERPRFVGLRRLWAEDD